MQPSEVDDMLKQKICWQITDQSIAQGAHKEAYKCWDEAWSITVYVMGFLKIDIWSHQKSFASVKNDG